MTTPNNPNPDLDEEESPIKQDLPNANKSAQEFADSIASGDLYKGLKGEDRGE